MRRKIKKILLKKEKGNVSYFLIIMIVIFLVSGIALYELSFQKTMHLKNKVDNGIILSALSANVIDIYQYATYSDVAYATSYTLGGNNDGYIDVNKGNKDAGRIALERFLDSLNYNLNFIDFSHELSINDNTNLPIDSNDTLVKSARIDEFILYNVIGGKIYKTEKDSNGDFTVTELQGNSDPDIEKAANIQHSSIYIKMTCKFYVIGEMTIEIPFEELIDITIA